MALAIPVAHAVATVTPEQMQERFKQMQTMMDEAGKATTPEARNKLMAGHMKAMQDQMGAMGAMMGDAMKMGNNDTAAMDPNMTAHMQMMGQHMAMMHQMMGQMMGQMMMMAPAP